MNPLVLKALLSKGLITHNKKIIKLEPGDLLTMTDQFNNEWVINFHNIDGNTILTSSDYSFGGKRYYDNTDNPRNYYRWYIKSIQNIRFTNIEECELLLQFVDYDKEIIKRFLKKNYE